MSRSIPFSTTFLPGTLLAHRTVICAVLLVVPVLALLIGEAHTAAGNQARPTVQIVGADITPTPRPSRPEINRVSRGDGAVVRPDELPNEGVNDLPASGIGFTDPADGDIHRWTTLAIAALALNTVVLFGVAVWSLRRRCV